MNFHVYTVHVCTHLCSLQAATWVDSWDPACTTAPAPVLQAGRV